MVRSSDRVSPVESVTSAVTWKWKIGSSFSGMVRSGFAGKVIVKEPSGPVAAVPWAISWAAPRWGGIRHQ